MDRLFSGLGFKHFAFDAHNITDIIFLKIRIGLFANAVPCHIGLDISLQILDITKRCLAHHTFGHDTSRNGNLLSFQCLKIFLNLHTVMGYIIFHDFKGIPAVFTQSRQLFPSHFQQLVNILLLRVILLLHCLHSFYSNPIRISV